MRSSLEEHNCDVVLLQEIGRELQAQIVDFCRGKGWHTCFSSGDDDPERCAALTGIVSKRDFDEEEGGGVEIHEGKTTRFFAAARQRDTWFVSCHVPPPNQAVATAKLDAGMRTVQKLVQEVHRKGRSLIAGGDWNVDVKGLTSKVCAHMPYGCSSCEIHTEDRTCFG